MRSVHGELLSQLGRAPTQQEVAAAMGVSATSLAWIRRVKTFDNMRSFDDSCLRNGAYDDGRRYTLAEVLSTTDRRADHAFFISDLQGALDSCLSPRERTVLRMRYGLFGMREHTLEEVTFTCRYKPLNAVTGGEADGAAR